MQSLRRGWSGGPPGSIRAVFRRPSAAFRKVSGDLSLRDTVQLMLVPCYDLTTGGTFLFSRVDAVETLAYNFPLRDVCAATCVGSDGSTSAVEVRSSDGTTRLVAVSGGVTLGNPMVVAITHVLNNKREFPLASGIEDLLVISIGSGGAPERTGTEQNGSQSDGRQSRRQRARSRRGQWPEETVEESRRGDVANGGIRCGGSGRHRLARGDKA